MVKHRSLYFWKILKNRKGFTMTEVVVVLSLIGIMTAISVPSYFSWLPKHRLRTSVRQIYDDMNLSKFRAVKDNTNAVIIFTTAPTNKYTVFLDRNGNGIQDDGVVNILRNNVALENGVDIIMANTCGFNNRGLFTAGPGGVTLTNPTGAMGINVNIAGNITVF
jgi:prepilin-type N-terminal cleavage/methylation domain-containing protein